MAPYIWCDPSLGKPGDPKLIRKHNFYNLDMQTSLRTCLVCDNAFSSAAQLQ